MTKQMPTASATTPWRDVPRRARWCRRRAGAFEIRKLVTAGDTFEEGAGMLHMMILPSGKTDV